MADSLPYPVWILDERGDLVHANQAILDKTSRTLAQLSGSAWKDLIQEDDREAFGAALARSLKEGALYDGEIRFQPAGGEGYRWYAVNMAPIRDGAQRAVRWFCTGKDIHERKLEDEALRESERRNRLMTDTSNDGAFYWDVKTNVNYWTDRLLQLIGLTREDWGQSVDSFFGVLHPDDIPLADRNFKAHLEQRVPYAYEMRFRHSSGGYKTVYVRGQAEWDESGAPLRMAGGVTDITERKRMEQELLEKIAIIERQQEAIRKLSAPIIEVWEGVLTMPVLGAVDQQRATDMMSALLEQVVRTGCKYTIIDLTGAESLDTHTADHVIKVTRAVQLLGAQGIVVGIKPEVAQTMITAGVDLTQVTTLANLRQALIFCLQRDGQTIPRPGQRTSLPR